MPVTRTARDPNDFSPASGEEELDERARKRIEVGLSPRRPTAKSAVQRPPDVPTLPIPPWALSLLLVAVLVVTALLVVSNVTCWAPAWWPARAAALPGETGMAERTAPLADDGYRLRLAEEFSSASSTLLQGEQRQEWHTELLPAESIYRIQVWPGHLAWSLLGLDEVADYRLQTSVVVGADAPSGVDHALSRRPPFLSAGGGWRRALFGADARRRRGGHTAAVDRGGLSEPCRQFQQPDAGRQWNGAALLRQRHAAGGGR